MKRRYFLALLAGLFAMTPLAACNHTGSYAKKSPSRHKEGGANGGGGGSY